MSLASLAIRLATIRALKGATYAEDRVFDSTIQPVDLVAVEHRQSVIIVTTDDDDLTVTGRDLMTTDHALELVVEVAVAAKQAVEIDGGDGVEVLTIPATDAGLEASLNLIGWQIFRALTAGGGEWGDLWRQMVSRVQSITTRRGADDEQGVRYAARQYVFRLDHFAEPEPGIEPEPETAWGRFLALAAADQQFAPYAKIIRATIMNETPLDWQRVRNSLGLANDAADFIYSRPVGGDDEMPLDAIQINDDLIIHDTTVVEAGGGGEA